MPFDRRIEERRHAEQWSESSELSLWRTFRCWPASTSRVELAGKKFGGRAGVGRVPAGKRLANAVALAPVLPIAARCAREDYPATGYSQKPRNSAPAGENFPLVRPSYRGCRSRLPSEEDSSSCELD